MQKKSKIKQKPPAFPKNKRVQAKKRRKRKPDSFLYKQIALALLLLLLIVLVFLFAWLKISENGHYTVYDPARDSEPIAAYKHDWAAARKVQSLSNFAYAANEEGTITSIHSGLVNLNTKDMYTNTEYTDTKGQSGYLNGTMAYDALFLEEKGDQVLAEISGVKAWFDKEDIELVPYEIDMVSSSYTISNGVLYHTVMIDPATQYAQPIPLANAPDFLSEGSVYYSYDGNWFYDDLITAREDASRHDRAVNKEAWYAPAQYLPHHSSFQWTTDQANAFLARAGIQSQADSVLYNAWPLFEQVEAQTGINAAMMFALALNESAWGTSTYAVYNNNLFGHAAYDDNPDAANVYSSLYDCIYEHAAGFINNGFSNPLDWRWHGSWFGNKESGMNVSYASDPYWGEKAASLLYLMNPNEAYDSLKTFHTGRQLDVFKENNGKEIIYSYPENSTVSVIIDSNPESSSSIWYTEQYEQIISETSGPGYVRKSDLR